MEIDRELVLHIAKLANLELSDAEVTLFTKQLGDILHYIEKLKQVEEQAEPFSFSIYLPSIMRPDEVRPSLHRDQALQNAPEAIKGLFRVPKIIP